MHHDGQNRIITLTTDFGLRDTFVGEVKGVLLGIHPTACLVDLCHEIAAQEIHSAAFIFNTAYHYFPLGTIHLVVVDSGLGVKSKPIALETKGHIFVGPDNGIFSYILTEDTGMGDDDAGYYAVELSNQQYWRPSVSPTFRGRDIFAPVAAHLAIGAQLTNLGSPIEHLTRLPTSVPRETTRWINVATVVHVDRFGNVITNLQEPISRQGHSVTEVGEVTLRGVCRSYSDVEKGNLVAVVGSSGYLEISVRDGDAAAQLGIKIGDRVVYRPE